jgi:predicted nuclease of predicted toxin-antitoxin system
MKLLLDENLPKRLKSDLSEHQVFTVRDMGWSGLSNGDLITQMMQENFNVLVTFDKNLQYQQNLSKYDILVLVIHAPDNTYNTIREYARKVNDALAQLPSQGLIIID